MNDLDGSGIITNKSMIEIARGFVELGEFFGAGRPTDGASVTTCAVD
jgi:hypothetical protein